MNKTSGQGVAHKPNDENRKIVKMLSAVGTRHEDIATKLDITDDTLRKHYRKELDEGRIEANASVAQTLYQQAKNGNTTAAIFWLKTRAQWRENDRLEVTGADGAPMQMVVSWASEKS
jgi:predicted ArsR family transcriptional regulator